MNTFILLAMWLFPPLLVILINHARLRAVTRARNHDRILYSLCTVRDHMALAAAKGELSENSEMFKYFFGVIADVVHDHKNHPLCFRHIASAVKENYNQPVPTWKRRLVREIKKSDPATHATISLYVHAVLMAMREDKRIAIVDRTVSLFSTFFTRTTPIFSGAFLGCLCFLPIREYSPDLFLP